MNADRPNCRLIVGILGAALSSALLSLLPVTAAAQAGQSAASTAAAASKPTPRTPDGQPDISGLYEPGVTGQPMETASGGAWKAKGPVIGPGSASVVVLGSPGRATVDSPRLTSHRLPRRRHRLRAALRPGCGGVPLPPANANPSCLIDPPSCFVVPASSRRS